MNPAEVVPHVVGTRVPFWKGFYDWKDGAFYLASPFLVLWSARWFFCLSGERGHLLDDGHVGDTVVGVAFFAIVAIAGVLGIRGFFSARRDVVLDSACPCCGGRQIRNFGDPSDDGVKPLACATCIAYLRAKGVEVTEERLDAFDKATTYVVPPARYLPVVARDGQGHFAFQMPAMCAGRDGRSTAESESELLDAGLRDLKVPVCVNHTDDASLVFAPFEYKSGGLVVASYRFYRAFCALNRIV